MTKPTDSSDSFQRSILENLNTSILIFDGRFKLVYMNPAAEILLNTSFQSVRSMEANALVNCPDGLVESLFRRSIGSNRPFTEREMMLVLPEGKSAIVDCTVSPMPDERGERGILVEIQQLDRHLQINREERLRSENEAVRELVRGMAHEIKNPLGGLRGAAQLLEDEIIDPALREYTQIIMAEADRLKNLVDQMLGPNRLPTPALVNIHTLLERVRHLVGAEEDWQIPIHRDYDPSIPEVRVDSDSVIQAMLNIMRNAARVVRDQADGRITLRTRVLRRFTIGHVYYRLVVKVTIEDNGPGIPEEIRDRLFYPLVSASEGGVGLGLSIAQALINKHNGLVECRSKPGETRFNLLLPLEEFHDTK